MKLALEQSKAATKAKTEVFSRMSHDLRTPMNAIVGMASLGLDEITDENARHYFEKIEVSGHYLLGLINDILDMNRLESKKITLTEETVNFKQFLADTIAILQPLMDKRSVRLCTDFSAMAVSFVYCDMIRTRQIFMNFLSNAIKFSAPGSTVEWVCMDQGEEDGVLYYEMKFIDHGCGMSPDFLPRVFSPYEQERNPYSEENASSGLGMAIARNLIEIMGGTVEVKSQLGAGSTFTLHMHHRAAPEEALNSPEQELPAVSLCGRRVLVVEDHPLNREIEQKLLEKQGIIVTTAQNGKLGVEAFLRSEPHHYDAILMDVRMPVMDGLEAARAIRALKRADARSVPIIATTANAFPEDVQASKAAGMTAHLAKPIVPEKLYQTLQHAVMTKTVLNPHPGG